MPVLALKSEYVKHREVSCPIEVRSQVRSKPYGTQSREATVDNSPPFQNGGLFSFVPRCRTGSERLMLALAVLLIFLRLVFRRILKHFRIGDRGRDNVTTAGPLA